MLTIFNRAELLITYDLTRFNQVRYALEGAGIDYTYRTKDLASHNLGRDGNFAMNPDVRLEYKLYVHKNELDWAKTFL